MEHEENHTRIKVNFFKNHYIASEGQLWQLRHLRAVERAKEEQSVFFPFWKVAVNCLRENGRSKLFQITVLCECDKYANEEKRVALILWFILNGWRNVRQLLQLVTLLKRTCAFMAIIPEWAMWFSRSGLPRSQNFPSRNASQRTQLGKRASRAPRARHKQN